MRCAALGSGAFQPARVLTACSLCPPGRVLLLVVLHV